MAIDVYAIRGPGDRDGGEIFDPLLCDIQAALGRAAQAINSSTPVRPISLSLVHRSGLRRGHTVEVLDSFSGVSYRGVVVSVNHVVTGPTVYSTIQVEREA